MTVNDELKLRHDDGGRRAAAPADKFVTAQTVLRNSFWYGLSTAFGLFLALTTSIPIARIIGPQQLGYFNYLIWLTNISATLGGLGIPIATRKYMSEYLGRDEEGTARAVFFFTLRLQIFLAIVVTAAALILALLTAEPAYMYAALFVVGSMLPAMVMSVPSLANVAREDLSLNLKPGVVGGILYIILVAVSLSRGWGLLGIAIAMFTWRWVELALKMIVCLGWVNRLKTGSLTEAFRRKIFKFSSQSVALLLINMIIWDRSEMVFLKRFNDISQLAFYSVAFNITESIAMAPRVFAGAAGVTLMVQYGRNRESLGAMVSQAAKYLALLAFPLLFGAAALSSQLIQITYGPKYLPVIPVFGIAAILAVAKCLLSPVQDLLQATEKQSVMVRWFLVCSAFNILLDLMLIRSHAAVGAAIANGLAQLVGVLGLWIWAVRNLGVKFPFMFLAKLGVAAGIMAGLAALVARPFSPLPGAIVGVAIGVVSFFILVRVSRLLDLDDRRRLISLGQRIPERLKPWFERALDLLIPPPGIQLERQGGAQADPLI